MKAWVVEVFVFRKKTFLTRQAINKLRPSMLVLSEHMYFGLDHLRIIQRSRSDAIMVLGAMKSKWATAA
jgi:hypothetical protein